MVTTADLDGTTWDLGHQGDWAADQLSTLRAEPLAVYAQQEAPGKPKHLWIATDLGLYYCEHAPAAEGGDWRMRADLHPWSAVRGPRISFRSHPRDPAVWMISASLQAPAFSERQEEYDGEPRWKALADFGAACMRQGERPRPTLEGDEPPKVY